VPLETAMVSVMCGAVVEMVAGPMVCKASGAARAMLLQKGELRRVEALLLRLLQAYQKLNTGDRSSTEAKSTLFHPEVVEVAATMEVAVVTTPEVAEAPVTPTTPSWRPRTVPGLAMAMLGFPMWQSSIQTPQMHRRCRPLLVPRRQRLRSRPSNRPGIRPRTQAWLQPPARPLSHQECHL